MKANSNTVNDFWEDKFKEKLWKLHNEVKEHPFWKTLSNDFHADCMNKLKEMLDCFMGYFTRESMEKCPQAIILFEILHDIYDCMLKAKIMPKYYHMTVMEMKGFGNYILALQTALQLVHYYLDGIFDEDMVIGYTPRFEFDKDKEQYVNCTLYGKYGARDNDNGTFRLVQIINKDEIDKLTEKNKEASESYASMAKYFIEHNQKEYAEDNLKKAQYYEEKYNDLIDNKEKHYIVK